MRTAAFSAGRPTHWAPGEIVNPETNMPFTETSSWEFVAQCLESGEPLEEVELDTPPGKIAYVMRVPVSTSDLPVYVKLHLGRSGRVVGRSFHLSESD